MTYSQFLNDNSINESLVPKVLMKSKKEVTLYHGSPEYYKVLKPTGINFGNRLEKPSWSIFCFTDFESAKNWAAFRALMIHNRRIQDKTGEKIARHMFFDSINNIGFFSIDSLEDTKNRLIGNKKIPFYVYEFKAPLNEIGLGNDSTHDEYTYNNEVKNYKLHRFFLTRDNLEEFIIPKSDEERLYIEKKQSKHAHRGLATLLYDRDYSGQDREMIQAIFRDKKIKPGEDIETWMKENDFKFNKTTRIPGYGFLNEEYERPYSMKEIRKNYGKEYYNKLKNDPIHRWRAETGIELIHREPSKEELERIMKNWESMDDRRKRISDRKSMEVFGCNNRDNYNKLINTYNETLETRLTKPISNFQKEVTLYHGTDKRIPNKIIDPAYGRINTGTRISKPRYSTWWTRDPYFPYYYATSGTINKLLYDLEIIPKDIKLNLKNYTDLLAKFSILDHKNHTLYINKKYKNEVINAINNKPGYVYYVTVPWNIVGRGHDRTLDEYTLDTPIKANEDIVDFKTLCKYINVQFISENELQIRYKQVLNSGDQVYNPNIMEKIIYRTLDERKELGKKYKDITRRYYEK